ncbi:MAG TPA: flavin reductase [Saprospiraceae bacterium]|nr:flavin reductase [Saprospiraceae bacterium]
MQHISSEQISGMEQRFRAAFINSLGGFKSVVLVGTANDAGNTNLAIFNSLFHLGANPPLCGLIFRPDSVERHTLSNLEATGCYTINHLNAGIYHQAHQTSARYPAEVSEFEATGLTPSYKNGFPAPFVQESQLQFSVLFREKIHLSINNTILVIGQIQDVWIPENVQQADGFLDLEKAGTITCSGLDSYHQTKRLARLSYAKPDKLPDIILP